MLYGTEYLRSGDLVMYPIIKSSSDEKFACSVLRTGVVENGSQGLRRDEMLNVHAVTPDIYSTHREYKIPTISFLLNSDLMVFRMFTFDEILNSFRLELQKENSLLYKSEIEASIGEKIDYLMRANYFIRDSRVRIGLQFLLRDMDWSKEQCLRNLAYYTQEI